MRIQVFKSRNSRSNFGVIYDIQHFQRWNRPQAVRTDRLAALLGGCSARWLLCSVAALLSRSLANRGTTLSGTSCFCWFFPQFGVSENVINRCRNIGKIGRERLFRLALWATLDTEVY